VSRLSEKYQKRGITVSDPGRYRFGILSLLPLSLMLMYCGCFSQNPDTSPGGKKNRAERIICGSPAVTEIIFALGYGDRVVGISDYTIYPPEALKKPSIGGLLNPNLERLLKLEPDWIITQGHHQTLASFSDQYGIRFQAVTLDRLEDLCRAIDLIAKGFEIPNRGHVLKDRIRAEIESVRSRVADRERKRVLILLERRPGDLSGLTTIGPGSFLDDALSLAGGDNLFSDARGFYPQVSKESILMRAPEVILELHPNGLSEDLKARLRSDWDRLPGLPNITRIEFLTSDYLLIPGPRVGRIIARLAEAVHPEVFHD